MYGREEEAEKLIDLLTLDKDPIIRYGGMLTIAMAYCSTSNNNAIRRLLHFAVSDVSDDVRRAAVFGLEREKKKKKKRHLLSISLF